VLYTAIQANVEELMIDPVCNASPLNHLAY
jgi:hypothetical protein